MNKSEMALFVLPRLPAGIVFVYAVWAYGWTIIPLSGVLMVSNAGIHFGVRKYMKDKESQKNV